MMAQSMWLVFLVYSIGTSVAELCQEDELEVATGDCFRFRLCREGEWKELSCTPKHQVFDPFQGKCVSTQSYCLSQTRSADHCTRDLCKQYRDIRCTNGQTKTLGCKLYSECISGTWVQVECKEGETVKEGQCSKGTCLSKSISCVEYTINGELVKCESGYYFDEILSKCTPGVCESLNNENACSEGEAKGVEGACKKYKKCVGGVFVDKKCSQCQNFDENSKKCVFVWDKPCIDGDTTTVLPPTTKSPAPSPPSDPTEAPTTGPTTSPTTGPTTPPPVKCMPGTRKPDYDRCSHYFECDKQSRWQNKSCWWFFFFKFDVNTSKCKFWSAECARK
ncbi:uncharacterized protein [Halyomorpha halys]|uniref:uncharacterized protein n=1 Tax=Halyomorpha halys TaxID=286706 RepID=UPI0006D5029E|nr:uncharacterized protein LOC106692736 [Halyomorpha halys]